LSYQSGNRFTPKIIENLDLENKSGMYGIKEWVEHNGYTYETLYNRYIDSVVKEAYPAKEGITFADFKVEIDAGRPAILHLEGHSMVAYGYTEPDTVYVHDTGSEGEHTMTWGGTYSFGTHSHAHRAMTLLTVSGGSAEPGETGNSALPAILPLLLD